MQRREFLKLLAASGAGAVVFTGCEIGEWGNGDPEREFLIQSSVLNPEDLIYNRNSWYATAFSGVSGGSGLVVRVFEGRAKKVEGNPIYPMNLGRSNARDQSLVQEVYHPDRIATPLRLVGERGSGNYEPITWDDALQQVAQMVQDAGGSSVLITHPVSGALGRVITQFTEATGARHVVFERDENVVLREAMRRVFGVDRLPTLDLENSRFIVSFSAEFLHDWIAPVFFQMGFGEFRQGRLDVRGTYWHVGPQLSATAANADKWLPISPGTEGLVALAIAQVIASENLVPADRVSAVYEGIDLEQYTPELVAELAISGGNEDEIRNLAENIRQLARLFVSEQPSVAIAGSAAAATTNGLFNLTAVYALNYLVGNVNQEGGLILNPDSPAPEALPAPTAGVPFQQWTELANELREGQTQLLLLHSANPNHNLPAAIGFDEALASVPNVVSFSSFLDDTTVFADLILPDHTTLEGWGVHVPDPGPGYPIVALQQPVVKPYVASRSFGESLIAIASLTGSALPWESFEAVVRDSINALSGAGGNVQADNPKEFFLDVQTQGGWWDETAVITDVPTAPTTSITPSEPEFAGEPGEYPFYLLPFPTNSLGIGDYAHLPWLQALPEPISTVVWTTWVELNPHTADELGVETGHIVRLTTPNGSIEVPVYENPAAAPDIALVPMGQGHTIFTRYAEKRGENPLDIVAPVEVADSGALAWAATRVRIEKVDRKIRLPRFEGSVPAYQLEEFPIIQVTRPESS